MSKHQFMKLSIKKQARQTCPSLSKNGVILRNDLLKILYQFIKNAVKMSVNKAIVNTLV